MIKTEIGERIDYVNDNLSLIQKPCGLKFGTDALLLAGYIARRAARGAELGAGSGIISLLLLTRDKLSFADCYEIQDEYASLTERNAELNGLSSRLSSILLDVRDYHGIEKYDAVYTNPPYMKTDTGYRNCKDAKNLARHEVSVDISDFLLAAARMLKYGGSFYAVYRPDRLSDLIIAMKEAKIEPKRMTLVYADTGSIPKMLLVEGRKGGGEGLFMTPPLIIYKDCRHDEYSEHMSYIMDNGVFPDLYLKRR